MAFRLDGKSAVVTGGTRGIGKAAVQYLANKGARVVFSGRNEETLKQAEREFRDMGLEASGVRAEAGDPADAERLVDTCVNEFGGIDILVNNAGITRDSLAIRMKDEGWDEVIRVNLTGAFHTSRAAAKAMMRAKKGRIVQVSSVVGLMGNAGQANYAASKAGLIGMAKSLARELAPRGVTVNVVAPGFIETDMTSVLKEEIRESVLRDIPLGRFGSADEVASVIGFLASDEAAYITGQVFAVDGGLAM